MKQELLEPLDHVRPVDSEHRGARSAAHPAQQLGRPSQFNRACDEAARIKRPRQHSRHPVLEMHAGRRVVVGDHREPTRHRLECDVPEGLGLARKQKDVCRGVVRGKVSTCAKTSEDQVWMCARERRTHRAIAHHDQAKTAVRLLHRPIGRDRQLDVLLRRESADVQNDQIVIRRAPLGAEREGAMSWIEGSSVYPTTEHGQALEARCLELIA